MAVVGNDAKNFTYCTTPYIENHYCGTGDLFASIFFANILKGNTFGESIQTATEITFKAVKNSANDKSNSLYFESILNEIE